MDNEFITFRKFNDPALAEEMVMILTKNATPFSVTEEMLSFDPTFASSAEAAKDYLIKIKQGDFLRAEDSINQSEKEQVDKVAKDHYLLDFNNVELIDIIAKEDEWSNFDVLLARKILTERGIDINESALKKERLETLRAPTKANTLIVVIGYLFALLGGGLGCFIGWRLAYAKTTLPNGERVFIYPTNDRKNGERMFWLGIAVFILVVIVKISDTVNNPY
ncbi:MAG: hypothetical protein ABIN95_08785 [Mucilaginibacter sp.]